MSVPVRREDSGSLDVSSSDASLECLDRVEGLGSNCELGFVLRRQGHEKGGFFRWTAAPISAVLSLIERDFEDVFRFENLSSLSTRMVRDSSSGVGFHSKMHSTGSRVREFIESEDRRREIYLVERGKVDHLISKFMERYDAPNLVYCVKTSSPADASMVPALAQLLSKKRKHKPFRLLHVLQSNDPSLIGVATAVDDVVWRGHVGWFAPTSKANHADYDAWNSIISICLGQETGRVGRR